MLITVCFKKHSLRLQFAMIYLYNTPTSPMFITICFKKHSLRLLIAVIYLYNTLTTPTVSLRLSSEECRLRPCSSP